MTVADLHDQLTAAGIPVVTVRLANGTPTVVYADSATAQQRQQGNALAATADLRPRRPRPLATVAQALADWIAAGSDAAARQQRLTRVAIAGGAPGLIAYPRLATLLGIGVDGDEPDV